MAKHSSLRELSLPQLRLRLFEFGPDETWAVRYDCGDVAFKCTPDKIRLLADRGMIRGRVKGADEFLGFYLTTSIRAALRTINQCEANLFVRPSSITINRGSRGRKTWVERLDRAASGIIGGAPRTLHMRPAR